MRKPREHRTSRAHWPRLYQELQARLIWAREEAGLTQREAAERLGRSQSFIAKCETGERRIDVIELAELAAVYGKSILELVPQGLSRMQHR